jgi:hypothetical protein
VNAQRTEVRDGGVPAVESGLRILAHLIANRVNEAAAQPEQGTKDEIKVEEVLTQTT